MDEHIFTVNIIAEATLMVLPFLAVFIYSWVISGEPFLFSALALIPLGVFVAFLMLAFGYTAYRTHDWKKNVL
ncbi:MAG: hypothetical protein KGD64_15335 [Candidatus Heimdallarchaeota archaeon]|nr:hypothetical protein [Candidatus Heimdallarchaeota archaeon]